MKNQRRITTNNLIETFLGFSDFANTNVAEATRNFPPHDIIEDTDESISIVMAVAGYPRENISIDCDTNILTVTGRGVKPNDSSKVLRSGISYKDFSLTWTISSHYEVTSAHMDNGLLTIKMDKLESKRKQSIEIK